MPLVKDASYREIPYSSETPEEDYHLFMSLKQVVEKTSKHQNHLYRCRTVGVVYSKGQVFTLHELEDRTVVVRLSLMYMKNTPYAAVPFTAQLFGFVHWRAGVGPCMYALHLAAVPPSIARTLLSTMKWVVDSHHAMNPGWRRGRKRRARASTSSSAPEEIAGPSQMASPVPSHMCQGPCQGAPQMHFQRLVQMPCQEPSLMASQVYSLVASQAASVPFQMASHVPSQVPFQGFSQRPFQVGYQLASQGPSQMASQVPLNGPGAEEPPMTRVLDDSIWDE